jgi:hypothetical protein
MIMHRKSWTLRLWPLFVPTAARTELDGLSIYEVWRRRYPGGDPRHFFLPKRIVPHRWYFPSKKENA